MQPGLYVTLHVEMQAVLGKRQTSVLRYDCAFAHEATRIFLLHNQYVTQLGLLIYLLECC